MLACDFFHVDCAGTLKRIYVFFVLEVGCRYVTTRLTMTSCAPADVFGCRSLYQ